MEVRLPYYYLAHHRPRQRAHQESALLARPHIANEKKNKGETQGRTTLQAKQTDSS